MGARGTQCTRYVRLPRLANLPMPIRICVLRRARDLLLSSYWTSTSPSRAGRLALAGTGVAALQAWNPTKEGSGNSLGLAPRAEHRDGRRGRVVTIKMQSDMIETDRAREYVRPFGPFSLVVLRCAASAIDDCGSGSNLKEGLFLRHRRRRRSQRHRRF